MFKQMMFCGLLLAAATPALPAADALEPIVVSKTVRENPTLYFTGVPGNNALSQALRSILGACGWFDVVDTPKAALTLTATTQNGRIRLELTSGGAPAGAWSIPAAGNARLIAKRAVDAIIEKNFKELKVKGFCNSRIAFCAQTASGIRNVYACDIDGEDLDQITNFNSLCVEPCWFPDGKSVGYSKYNKTGIQVLQTQLNPKRTRVLTSFPGINAGAAISPDGSKLAVILSPDHKVDLYVKNISGGQPRRLTNNMAVEASPCWSPDSRELAFVSDETGKPRIYIISADGRSRRQIPTIGSDAVTPDWSSDGKIVYATRVDGNYTVAVYDLNKGTNERVVTVPGNWESPAWAADNRQVVCKRSDGRHSSLYVIDTWTGRTRRLLATPYNLSMPVWSPCAK